MFRLTRSLPAVAAAALAAGQAAAQPPLELEERPQAARTLCPMPVAPARASDRSRVFQPRPSIRYHIQNARVPCHNPLFAGPETPLLVAVPNEPRGEELAQRRLERRAASPGETLEPAAGETPESAAEDPARSEERTR